jgi:ribose transport system permease protein
LTASALPRQESSAVGALLRAGIGRLAPAFGLLLVILVFALITDSPARYLSAYNLRIVLSQTVIVAIGAIGMTMIIVSGGIDLSVGATIALTGVITAITLRQGWSPWLALGVARGVAKWVAHEQTVIVPSTWINDLLVSFPKQAWLVFAPGVWIALGLALVAAFVLSHTVFGRRIFALGSNEAAARACGIDTSRLRVAIYGSAGLLFGLAGVMQMSRLRLGDPTVANGAELDIIAAVVIGGGSLAGGEGSIVGALIGALIMAFLRNGCQQMGWPNYIQEIIIGTIIVLAVALDRVRAQWSERSAAMSQAADG